MRNAQIESEVGDFAGFHRHAGAGGYHFVGFNEVAVAGGFDGYTGDGDFGEHRSLLHKFDAVDYDGGSVLVGVNLECVYGILAGVGTHRR